MNLLFMNLVEDVLKECSYVGVTNKWKPKMKLFFMCLVENVQKIVFLNVGVTNMWEYFYSTFELKHRRCVADDGRLNSHFILNNNRVFIGKFCGNLIHFN